MNTHRVTFNTGAVDGIYKDMPAEEVLAFVKAIGDLGWTPEVTLLDEDNS